MDGAVFSDDGKVGFGWILRDHIGVFCAAGQGSSYGPSEASLDEALSMREALSWLKHRSLTKIIIESDSLDLVQSLRSSHNNNSPIGLIY